MRFYFYIDVVVNCGDMTDLPVGSIEWKLEVHRCDICGGVIEVGGWVYIRKVVPAVVSGNMVKVVCEASRDGGV